MSDEKLQAALNAVAAERDKLQEAVDAERPFQLANLQALTEERDRLRLVIHAAVVAIETVLTGDNVDMKAMAGELLGRTSAALKQSLDPEVTDG